MRKKDKILLQEARKRGRPKGSTKKNIPIKKPDLIVAATPVDYRFKKGAPRGPGRPVGSRNKLTMALEAVGEGNAILVYQKLVDLALGRTKEGDATSCKMILDRVLPVRKDRKIALDIEGSVGTAKAISAISTKVTDMMVKGELSPSESLEIGNKIEQHLKIITDVDIMDKIEGAVAKVDKMPKVGE